MRMIFIMNFIDDHYMKSVGDIYYLKFGEHMRPM